MTSLRITFNYNSTLTIQTMNKLNGKRVQLELVGLDGNAFALMGAFQRQAQREKWAQQEIKTVLDDCMLGDYDHLLAVLAAYTQSTED